MLLFANSHPGPNIHWQRQASRLSGCNSFQIEHLWFRLKASDETEVEDASSSCRTILCGSAAVKPSVLPCIISTQPARGGTGDCDHSQSNGRVDWSRPARVS